MQFLNKYGYIESLYSKHHGCPVYNWRRMEQYDPYYYNTIYTLRDNHMDRTSLLLPLCIRKS